MFYKEEQTYMILFDRSKNFKSFISERVSRVRALDKQLMKGEDHESITRNGTTLVRFFYKDFDFNLN